MVDSRRRFDEWQQTALWVGGFAVLLWILEFVDVLLATDLNQYGVEPRSSDGLLGVLFAPLLHGSWAHLWSNTVPLLVLGFLALITGVARGLLATAVIWVVAGLGVWVVGGPDTVHIGASGLVFGWITYLGVRGFLTGRNAEVIVGVLVLVFYGSVLLGVLPGQAGVSWEGHLFGAIGGVLAAFLLQDRAGRRPGPASSYPGRS
jgi:membrane associated rhomboid family serine protease